MGQKDSCPVCGSSLINAFLERRQVPVLQNVLMKDRESTVAIARGDLKIAFCRSCGFVFNQSFEPALLRYGELYDNKQECSPHFKSYLDSLANYLIWEKNVQNCHVIEVGCGDGSFLRRLVESEETGNRGYGFDPSYVGPLTDLNERLKFERGYYGAEYADIQADAVICRHVIEHVPEPLQLLRAIRQALVDSSQPKVFLETPCVEWILRNQVIWDFFYEHCSWFTAESLTTAVEASGFEVKSLSHVFRGQYLLLEAVVSRERKIPAKNPGCIPRLAEDFALAEDKLGRDWRIKIQKLESKGKVAIWGAGAKGVTFANLVDPDCKLIDCVVDLNPNKQGKYLPGTGHRIVSPPELAERGVTVAVLMNPNYREEIQAWLLEAQLAVQLIE